MRLTSYVCQGETPTLLSIMYFASVGPSMRTTVLSMRDAKSIASAEKEAVVKNTPLRARCP